MVVLYLNVNTKNTTICFITIGELSVHPITKESNMHPMISLLIMSNKSYNEDDRNTTIGKALGTVYFTATHL